MVEENADSSNSLKLIYLMVLLKPQCRKKSSKISSLNVLEDFMDSMVSVSLDFVKNSAMQR